MLRIVDLFVDAVYEGGSAKTGADDPISNIFPGVGTQGGFRPPGRKERKFVVLYTSGEDRDWPDHIDLSTGRFTYYGDNKKPGHELHDTRPGGNDLLRRCFGHLHAAPPNRALIPPFFICAKCPTENSNRSVQFKGLAVPGFPGLSQTEDLVAVWKAAGGQRFQNYRSVFTILDIPIISRAWLNDLAAGNPLTDNTPMAWAEWVRTGKYLPLTAEPTTIIRSVDEQSCDTPHKSEMLNRVWLHFNDAPIAFEAFAAHIFQMTDQRVIVDEITRSTIDGGRDAFGRYLLGIDDDPVYAEFSLEAKCYRPPLEGQSPNTVGVKEVSRLISRIRHRQFGVLVTTSVIARQAYQEVREDRHPIIFICGRDIAEILIKAGYNSVEQVENLLNSEFSV